jgi:hypothetical protein
MDFLLTIKSSYNCSKHPALRKATHNLKAYVVGPDIGYSVKGNQAVNTMASASRLHRGILPEA